MFGLSGRAAVGAWGARTDSKQKDECSDWVGMFGGDTGRTSGCNWVRLFFNKLGGSKAKRVGEAGGAEGSVGDLVPETAFCSLVFGRPGKADTGGFGCKCDVGGDTGALGLCEEVTGWKSGLVGGGDIVR